MLAKLKNLIKLYEKDVILAVIIILVALISFGLGRLSKIKEGRVPLIIENAQNDASAQTPSLSGTTAEGAIVASKNGTKYHYPWCPGAATIKEENKITFSTIEEARKAGYQPASNCKGLK
ncbi:MAG: hypothetical protein WC587_00335 [Candidatus Paceibacterota bacterium]